jgi:tripartite-type tricarboxylate transporter receptor subunit TctC
VAAGIAAKAVPDGHTLLGSGGALWAEPIMKHESYDPLQYFAPVTIATRSPNVVVVHPSLPANSIKDLIAMAKAKPGVLNYGSSTAGTSSHLAAELFKNMASVDIMRIGYKGTGAALNALIGGEVQVMFSNAGAEPHRRAGKIKGLAVTSAEPSALFPGLPTVAATVPGYESVSIIAIFAPVKTPPGAVSRLNQEIVRILQRSDIKEKFLNTGAEAVGSTAAQLGNAVRSESARLAKLIKDANIRAE